MATVLCTWELGANLGHLANLRRPIEAALQWGHRVVLAARLPQNVPGVFAGLNVECVRAPFKPNPRPMTAQNSLSMTHVLSHQCFATVAELQTYLLAWRALYAEVRPDLVLFEHSPVALMAAWGEPFRKVVLGHGFSVPPPPAANMPFAPFPGTPANAEMLDRLRAEDAALLRDIQRAQAGVGMARMEHLGQLYGQADQQWLMTWPELDHFGPRVGAAYIGSAPLSPGGAPPVMERDGRRVFGYLNSIPSQEALLRALQQADVDALLYVRGLDPALRQAFESRRIRFLDRAVDLHQVASSVDWVIGQAGHGTMAHFALRGIPQLLIPAHQEQYFITLRMLEHGAAAMAYQNQQSFERAVGLMQSHPPLRAGAQALAQAMASSVPENVVQQTTELLEQALAGFP